MFKLGDTVRCTKHGIGKITKILDNERFIYPIIVTMVGGEEVSYVKNGLLYQRIGKHRITVIDVKTVPTKDQLVFVRKRVEVRGIDWNECSEKWHPRYLAYLDGKGRAVCYRGGCTSTSTEDEHLTVWGEFKSTQ